LLIAKAFQFKTHLLLGCRTKALNDIRQDIHCVFAHGADVTKLREGRKDDFCGTLKKKWPLWSVHVRHRPEETVLHRVVSEVWPSFRERVELLGTLPMFGMSDTAVWLTEHVLPTVPIRQWVCSLPYGLRALAG
jgi:hypothetical protein